MDDYQTQTKVQAWSSLVFLCRSSSVGLETGEWRRCRSLSLTPKELMIMNHLSPAPLVTDSVCPLILTKLPLIDVQRCVLGRLL